MKKVGIIGGMGPESTLEYYKRLNYGFQACTGDQENFPPLVIESVNIFAMLRFCTLRDYDGLTEYLLEAITNVRKAGADFAAMAANTPHIIFDRLSQVSPIPLVSIINSTCEAVEKSKIKRVGLLGTLFTMQEDFFKAPFRKRNIDIIAPDIEEAQRISSHIINELERGIVKDSTRSYFLSVINAMIRQHSIQGVILACTELPLLITADDISVASFDTMDIHINSILSMIVS
ncbi:MAG: amino acid racemase [Deltaproteobacteria bacterium]|jgi:aspartate racemase|nr:amino acid racemase [Deltaproteobacteria bacterium]